MNKRKNFKTILFLLFLVYIGFIFWITIISREKGVRPLMLTPFWEYAKVVNNDQRVFFIRQIVGNIVLFIPLGVMLPLLPNLKNIKCINVTICGFGLSVLIELTQYITAKGWVEFDDVFNNTVGAMIGYGLYKLTNSIKS